MSLACHPIERHPAVTFPLGRLVISPMAQYTLAAHDRSPMDLLYRHQRGDFGKLDPEDVIANLRALKTGERIVSIFHLNEDVLWVVTEAETVGEAGVPTRDATLMMHPSEY